LRSRGVSITGAVQTLGQLSNLYGQEAAEAIVANFNTKLFFGGGLGMKDAAFASALSGTMTAAAATITDLAHDGLLMSSESQVPVGRAVLLPEEVARPAMHPLLGAPTTVFPPDTPPVYAYLMPAHELWQMAWALASGGSEAPRPARAATIPTRGLTHENMQSEIARLKKLFGWRQMSARARSWWRAQERKYRHAPAELLSRLNRLHDCLALYERLERPHACLAEEFVDAAERSGTKDFTGNVAFYTWCLTVRWEQQSAGRAP
jgi:hypothetical protein